MLSQLEKRIGSAVRKARSYYETRIKLRNAKENLTKAKHRFERAQALYAAANELALISVRNYSNNKSITVFYFQVDYINEAVKKKSNENAVTWNETYRHAIAQVCFK